MDREYQSDWRTRCLEPGATPITARCSTSRRTSTRSWWPRRITCTRPSRWRPLTSASTCRARSRSPGPWRKLESSRRRPRASKVATQMGNPGHSSDDARAAGRSTIWAGAIGDVHEVRVSTDRPLGYWPQAVPRPEPATAAATPGDESRWDAEALLGEMAAGDGARFAVPGEARLGYVPRGRADVRRTPRLPPLQLARLGRLGRGSARRHGRASDRHAMWALDLGYPDVGRNGLDAVQQGVVYPAGHAVYFRVPGARPAGLPVRLTWLRRRSAPEETRGDRQRGGSTRPAASCSSAPRASCCCRTLGANPRLLPKTLHDSFGCRRRSCRASRRAARDELGRGGQGDGRSVLSVRLRRTAHRSHAPRDRPLRVGRRIELGRREHARDRHRVGQPVPEPRVSSRLVDVVRQQTSSCAIRSGRRPRRSCSCESGGLDRSR